VVGGYWLFSVFKNNALFYWTFPVIKPQKKTSTNEYSEQAPQAKSMIMFVGHSMADRGQSVPNKLMIKNPKQKVST